MRSTYWTTGYWSGFYWLPLYWPIRFTDGCPPDSEIEALYQLAVRGTNLGNDTLVTASLLDAEIEGIPLGITAEAYGDIDVTVVTC